MDQLYDSIDFYTSVTRARYEELSMDLFRNCLEPLDRVLLRDAKTDKSSINEVVVLVGGSTRIPKIQEMVREYFNGKEPNCFVNPEEAVVYGAAAVQVLPSSSLVLLLDVTPLTLKLRLLGV